MTLIQIPTTTSTFNKITCPPTFRSPEIWNKITFIGEAASRNEEIEKEGFVGSSGKMLKRICENSNINLDHSNKTNVVKKRPAGDNFGIFYHDPKERTKPTEELIWWRQLLIAELQHYRPNLAVACGNEALKALTNLDGITKWQGSILESSVIPQLKVIPVLHPSYIMRDNWEWYYITQRYFKRIKIEATSPQILQKEPADDFQLSPGFQQSIGWLQHIQTSNQPWYLDIETRGDTITCFGLSSQSRPNQAICIPIQTTVGPFFSVPEEVEIWRQLSITMRDNPFLRNQNIVYDLDYMLDFGCEPAGIDFDPMIGMNVAYPEFDKGLDFTTSIYSYFPYYKDEGKTWGKKIPDPQVWKYNCRDMTATPKVTEGVIKDLKSKNLFEIAKTRSMQFLPIAIEMQRNKLQLHREWHQRLAGLLAEERIKKHNELTNLINRDINVKSSQQIQQLLYDELRLPVKKKRGTGQPTVDEYSLKELRAETGNPILTLILAERHLRTKESNYINVEFDKDPDGELYLGYQTNIGGTKTGRWSFNQSPKWRGSSPQTIPKIMRLMYRPPAGSVFWQRDLSQAEARVVAWLSNCRFLLDVFNSPIKIHKLVGSRIFRKPVDEILSNSLEYDLAKRIVHGYNYMMGYKKLAIISNTDYEFARLASLDYGREVPEIDAWHKQTKETAIKTGQLVTPMGRIRECYRAASAVTHTGQLPDEILRDLVSYVPQSTIPDVLNEGMLRLWNELPDIRWHMQGHDSYLCSGAPERTHEIFERAEKAAEVHFNINNQDCFIPGEFTWGYLWGAMLKYNPGEDTSFEAWEERAKAEGCFDEKKITEKLYSLF